jgi:hypothetical protein
MIKRLLNTLFPPAGGFGSAGIRRHKICGAILVVGGGGWENAQLGVETDEVGMNIKTFSCRYYLAINRKLENNVGEPRARSFTDAWSRDIKMAGEIIGPIPYSIATACEIANDTNLLGDGSGDIFLDEATDSQTRGDWRAIDMSLSSDPLILAT